MNTITDEYMRQMLTKSRQYCIIILKAVPRKNEGRGFPGDSLAEN